MEAFLFTVLMLLLLFFLLRAAFSRKAVPYDWSVRRSDHQESHVYYYDRRGYWRHVQGDCSRCITSKAVKLRRKGLEIDEVVLGQRNTCKW